MKKKYIPAVLMLVAALVAALVTYFNEYGLTTMVISVLVAALVFYFIGSVIELIMKRFEEENNKRMAEEGEVIEKESTSDESDEASVTE